MTAIIGRAATAALAILAASVIGVAGARAQSDEADDAADHEAPAASEEEGDAAPPEYEALITQALEESQAARWEEARVLFRRAHDLFPNARTLRGIGMVAFEVRDYPDAIRSLRLALADERRPLTDAQRTHAEELIERALAFVGRYDLSAVPEGATLVVDGHPAEPEPDGTVLLGAGPHHVLVRTDDGDFEGRFRVRGGEDAALPVDLAGPVGPEREVIRERVIVERAEPASPVGGYALAIGGAGVALIGVAIFIAGLLDYVEVQDAEQGTPWTRLRGAYDRAPILTGVGAAVAGVGAIAAVSGGVWLATSGGGEASGAGLRVGGTF